MNVIYSLTLCTRMPVLLYSISLHLSEYISYLLRLSIVHVSNTHLLLPYFASYWKVKIESNFPPKKVQDWIISTFHKPNNFPNCSPFGRSFCWPMSHLFWSTSLPNVTIGLYQTSTFLHKIYAQFCTFSQNGSYVYNNKQRRPYLIF